MIVCRDVREVVAGDPQRRGRRPGDTEGSPGTDIEARAHPEFKEMARYSGRISRHRRAVVWRSNGGVAQLVERYVRNVEVGGSSPLTSTAVSPGQSG